MNIELYRDLESFHAWAMTKILHLCSQLNSEALNTSYPLGMGTALATLQHIANAERIWLDRWLQKSPDAAWKSPDTIAGLTDCFKALAQQRSTWFESNPELFATKVRYRNLRGEEFHENLGGLVMHVLNHGVHHRAQMLYFLKKHGLTVSGGLDYIFYRLTAPTIAIRPEAAQNSRKWGLDVGDQTIEYQQPDLDALLRYAAYGDWAIQALCDRARSLNDQQLDHDWGMGLGSIRRTILHMYDAECFWQANWESPGAPFGQSNTTTSIAEASEKWSQMAARRTQKILAMGSNQLGAKVTVDFGGGPMDFRFSESLIQLAVHGTLHRAQFNNMLRSSGLEPVALDYVFWMRESND